MLIIERTTRYLVVISLFALARLAHCLDAHLLEVEGREPRHVVAHEVEVLGVDLARDLQVSQRRVVLAEGGDGLFQFAGSGVHHDILLCRGVVAHEVAFPLADGRAHKRQFVLSAFLLLVHPYAEVHHVASFVLEVVGPGKLERRASDGDAEERRALGHGLWHHDGAPLVADA